MYRDLTDAQEVGIAEMCVQVLRMQEVELNTPLEPEAYVSRNCRC